MQKTALVIGATGLIGQAVVKQLIQSEHIKQVITLTRRPVPADSPKVINHVVNFDQLDQYASLLTADYLFSCLGTTRRQAGSVAAQRKVDVDYQFKVAQLAAQQGVAHYLLVSSHGANEHSKNAYLQMKGELERRVQTLPFPHISIFQPSLLLGHREQARLGEKLGSWIFPLICRLPPLHRFRPIPGEQVAAKMVQVSQQPGPAVEWFRLDEIFIH